MSEHTAAVFVNHDASDDLDGFLERLGFAGLEPRGPVDGDEASSSRLDGVAIACQDGWTVVYNSPDMFGSGSLSDLDVPVAEARRKTTGRFIAGVECPQLPHEGLDGHLPHNASAASNRPARARSVGARVWQRSRMASAR